MRTPADQGKPVSDSRSDDGGCRSYIAGAMNVQPTRLVFRPTPMSAPTAGPTVPSHKVLPGWDKTEPGDLTGLARSPADTATPGSGAPHPAPGDQPAQHAVAGPPLTIARVRSGALPQDRALPMPAAAQHRPAAGITAPVTFTGRPTSPPQGWAPEGLLWRSPPPGMLAAIQEGGRARIASLFG
jgi:hypothetical protein